MPNMLNRIYSKLYFSRIKINNMIANLSDDEKRIYKTAIKGVSITCLLITLIFIFSGNAFFAGYTIDTSGAEDSFRNFFNETYGIIIGSATLIAVCLIAINIVTIMSSKNQRKIEQAVTWIKAIAIAWLFLCLISLVIGAIKTEFMIPVINGSDAPLFTY